MPGGRENSLTSKTFQLHLAVPGIFLLKLLPVDINVLTAVNGVKDKRQN